MPRASAEDSESVALYKRVVDSVVFIVTPISETSFAMGSGSLIDVERRYVITNYHVVDEKDKIHVLFPHHLKDGSIMTDKEKYLERVFAGQAIKMDPGAYVWLKARLTRALCGSSGLREFQ